MAVTQSTRTFRDGAGGSVTIRGYEDSVGPEFCEAGILFDHLGNVLTADSDPPSGVLALKATLMTAPQVIGYDAHDAAKDANNRPVLGGGIASDAAPAAVSADGDLVQAWYDRFGRAQAVVTERVGTGTPTYGVVTVDTTATGIVIKAANAKRRHITVVNHGTVDVFLGFDTSLSAANGALLVGVEGASLSFFTTAQIRAICASSQVVGYYEENLA